MKRKGFTLIEAIVALTLLAVLVISFLPAMQSTVQQRIQWEQIRSKNEVVRNLVTILQQGAPMETDDGIVPVSSMLEKQGGSMEVTIKNCAYLIALEKEEDALWWDIRWEGLDEPIRFMHPQ